jgi:hypothetical protein
MRSIASLAPPAATWLLFLAGLGLPEGRGQQLPAPVRDQDRRIEKRVESWQSLKRQNVVMQQTDYSCGAAALATVIRYYWGDPVTEADFLKTILTNLSPEELRERIKNGLSMTDLRRAAVAKGYLASIGRIGLKDLTELKAPVIVRIKEDQYDHFVVLRGLVNDRIFLADPTRGNIRVPICKFSEQWEDRAILVVAKPGAKLPENSPLLVRQHSPVQPELQTARRALVLRPAR